MEKSKVPHKGNFAWNSRPLLFPSETIFLKNSLRISYTHTYTHTVFWSYPRGLILSAIIAPWTHSSPAVLHHGVGYPITKITQLTIKVLAYSTSREVSPLMSIPTSLGNSMSAQSTAEWLLLEQSRYLLNTRARPSRNLPCGRPIEGKYIKPPLCLLKNNRNQSRTRNTFPETQQQITLCGHKAYPPGRTYLQSPWHWHLHLHWWAPWCAGHHPWWLLDADVSLLVHFSYLPYLWFLRQSWGSPSDTL